MKLTREELRDGIMALHHQTEARGSNMDPHLRQMLEALGLPLIAPEPEVVAADLARIRAKTLASFIARLLNENEPLLHAEHDGATVTVIERGGDGTMQFTIGEGEE